MHPLWHSQCNLCNARMHGKNRIYATYFLTIQTLIVSYKCDRRTDRQTDRRTTVTYVLFCDGQTLMAKCMGREQTGGKRSRNSVNTFRCKLCENNEWWRYVCGRERKRLAVLCGAVRRRALYPIRETSAGFWSWIMKWGRPRRPRHTPCILVAS